MKVEEIKKYLVQVGAKANVVKVLFSEDALPEDFVLEEAIAENKTSLEDVWKAKNPSKGISPEEKKQIETDAKTAAYNTAKQQLKSALGFEIPTDVNIKETAFKDVLVFAKKKQESMSATNDEQLKKQNDELIAKLNEQTEKITSLNSQIVQVKSDKEEFEKNYDKKFKTSQYLNNTLNSIPFAGKNPESIKFVRDSHLSFIEANFKVEPDGTFTNMDGTAVVMPDNNGVFKTVDEFLNHRVDTLGQRDVSNGGQVDLKGQPAAGSTTGKRVINGKEVPKSAKEMELEKLIANSK